MAGPFPTLPSPTLPPSTPLHTHTTTHLFHYLHFQPTSTRPWFALPFRPALSTTVRSPTLPQHTVALDPSAIISTTTTTAIIIPISREGRGSVRERVGEWRE